MSQSSAKLADLIAERFFTMGDGEKANRVTFYDYYGNPVGTFQEAQIARYLERVIDSLSDPNTKSQRK